MYEYLPWWILGAPILLALLDLIRTPKGQHDQRQDGRGRER